MNGHSLGAAIQRLRDALGGPTGSDAALLDRFALDRDPAAFAGLVARYGPMVLGLCRRIVGDPHLAEDVFQAVFLILARKAAFIRKRDAVGSWLYGVAYRLARKAKNRASGGRQPPGSILFDQGADAPRSPATDPAASAAWNDLLAALDRELHRLPDRLRAPLLLCYYDGCTQDEAARRLGWSFGTFRRRLDQARELLRRRMTARGATLGAGLLATVLATGGARAVAPAILSRTTIDAAVTFAAGGQLAGAAAQLAEEGLRMAVMSKVRVGVALFALIGGLSVGGGALFGVGGNPGEIKDQPLPSPEREGREHGGLVLHHGGAPFCHGSNIINVLVTPDGKTILTQGARTVRLWDAITGQDQGVLELPEDGPEFWTASLTPDGKTLLTTRHNGTGQVWDLAGRKMTRSFRLADPPFDVTGAKCVHSPDGKEIAVVTSDGSIRVCDIAAGKEMEQLRSHSDDITAATFTPDGKSLILEKGRNNQLVEWDVATGAPSRQRGGISASNLRFSADGKLLAAAFTQKGTGQTARGSRDCIVNVFGWNSQDGAIALFGNSKADQLMDFTPDGRYLLAPDSRSDGRILTQWDLRTGRAMRQYPSQDKSIQALAFTADGLTLITADNGLRFWDWKTRTEQRATSDDEHCYALTADGKAVVEGSAHGLIRIWDAVTGKELHRFDVPPPGADLRTFVTGVVVSPNGKYLAAQGRVARNSWTAAEGWNVWVWDLASEAFLHRLQDEAPHSLQGNRMTFGPDGRTLISTARDRPAITWIVATGKVDTEAALRSGAVVLFATNGKRRIVWDGRYHVFVRTLDSGTGSKTFSLGTDGGDSLRVAISSDGARLAVIDWGGRAETTTARIFDTLAGKVVGRMQNLPRNPGRIALSTNGALLAVASETENPSIQVLDVATNRELKHFTGLHGHAAWLAFAPDGKRLYAASTDTTVLGWEMGP